MSAERNWKIINREYDDKSVAFGTSVFTISNGYMSLKGDIQEFKGDRFPTTLLNGVFDKVDIFSKIRPSNRERRYLDQEHFDSAGRSPSVANLPDPLYSVIFIGGKQVSFAIGKVRDFQQVYNLKIGIYTCEFEYHDEDDRITRISVSRFCDTENLHRAYVRHTITAVNHSLPICIRAGIDGTVRSNITGERQYKVISRKNINDRFILETKTVSTGKDIRTGAGFVLHDTKCMSNKAVMEEESIYSKYSLETSPNSPVIIDRFIVITSSEDRKHGVNCDIEKELREAISEGYENASKRVSEYWSKLWEKIDIGIDGDDTAQLYTRFALFHLASAAPKHSDRLTVPCKLVTGEYYQGTTFYDTDLYIEPFYAFTNPGWTRNMISYRYHSLPVAKSIAEKLGYKGAKFAWQSGPDGIECLGDWYRFTKTNIHINGDVAYSLILYLNATGDMDFLINRGVDILVESSRFYASRVLYDNENDRYDLDEVTGPDEGHVAYTNEFYTNLLASKTLHWACHYLKMLKDKRPDDYKKIIERLYVKPEEMDIWNEIAEKITFYYDEKTKLYEQCLGFYKLKPVPENFLSGRDAWFATVYPYQALNQPDVIMGMALFRDGFNFDVRKANWEFYKPRSMNFSSMSYVINSIFAKETGEIEEAKRDFIISAGMDIDPNLTGRNDTHEGLHGTALGGAWMALVFGFGGILISESGLRVSPKLPSDWERLCFNIILRGEWLSFKITSNKIKITVGKERVIKIDAEIAGTKTVLESGQEYNADY